MQKTCEHCHEGYRVPPARAASRFCSKGCMVEAKRAQGARTIECAKCGVAFSAKMDHGAWPKFCSRACFHADHVKPEPKECACCGAVFMAGRTNTGDSEDGRRVYCSTKCAHEGLRRGEARACVHCGGSFYLSPSKVAGRPDESCCSPECQRAHYVGQQNPSYRGGRTMHYDNGDALLLVPNRPGYVGRYMAEHRVVASRVIGRMVRRGEVVLRINRQVNDNRPENLFLCESMSQAARYMQGALPWPTCSNLSGGVH